MKKRVFELLTLAAVSPARSRHGRQKVSIPECDLTDRRSTITLRHEHLQAKMALEEGRGETNGRGKTHKWACQNDDVPNFDWSFETTYSSLQSAPIHSPRPLVSPRPSSSLQLPIVTLLPVRSHSGIDSFCLP